MEYFEELALRTSPQKSVMWQRYFDNTYILWPHWEDVQELLNLVNLLRPSLQFILEKIKGRYITFPDIHWTIPEIPTIHIVLRK